ncbi:MAG: hypothetical protein ACI9M6_001637, partial [Hydrogenophaga sp.]
MVADKNASEPHSLRGIGNVIVLRQGCCLFFY